MSHYHLWLDKYNIRREQIVDSWSAFTQDVSDLRESLPVYDIFKTIENKPLPNIKMSFVDGGEGFRELMGFAVFFIRASAFVTESNLEDDLKQCFLREIDMNVVPHDIGLKEKIEVYRDILEFKVAINSIEKENVDLVVLDGSLQVKFNKKTADNALKKFYNQTLLELFELCMDNNVTLTGVSEDSSSRLFTKYIRQKYNVDFPNYLTDSTIIRILSPHHSFKTVNFTANLNGGKDFETCYLQHNQSSTPLRIDMLSNSGILDDFADIVNNLCYGSGHYGYPIPLYLAHMDASIPSKQMDWTVNNFINFISKRNKLLADSVLKTTRRNNRPKSITWA